MSGNARGKLVSRSRRRAGRGPCEYDGSPADRARGMEPRLGRPARLCRSAPRASALAGQQIGRTADNTATDAEVKGARAV